MADLAGFVHWVTKLKVAPKSADDAAVSQAERTKGAEFADKLAMPVLARSWQMLLKGMEEVSRAGNALMAAEMLLIRMAHVADMPSPEELARIVRGADPGKAAPPAQATASVIRHGHRGRTVRFRIARTGTGCWYTAGDPCSGDDRGTAQAGTVRQRQRRNGTAAAAGRLCLV